MLIKIKYYILIMAGGLLLAALWEKNYKANLNPNIALCLVTFPSSDPEWFAESRWVERVGRRETLFFEINRRDIVEN